MPSVEERLAKAEQDIQELQHTGVVAGLHAQAFGLSLVQADVAVIREQMAAGFAALDAKLDAILDRLDERP